jgi:hypothetical protein
VLLAGGSSAAHVEARLGALKNQTPDCLSESGRTALFKGCNTQTVSGKGSPEVTVMGWAI